jgi:hypothetical protein
MTFTVSRQKTAIAGQIFHAKANSVPQQSKSFECIQKLSQSPSGRGKTRPNQSRQMPKEVNHAAF